MRCPKCHYISFDSEGRCRNCGYEFALAAEPHVLDLPIQTGNEAIGPLSDLALSEPLASLRKAAPARASSDGPPASSVGIQPAGPITSPFDLPLFRDRATASDAPLVTPPAVPRAPLAVRRSTPAPRPQARGSVEEPELDLGLPEPEIVRPLRREAPVPSPESPSIADAVDETAAPLGSRLFAAIVDALIVGTVCAVVLYLTLQVSGLGTSQILLIPLAPFASFLLLIAGGYFTLFVAANGQTIGKMAAGVKVVPADSTAARVSLGHSVVRAAAYIVSALPAGLGFLTALFTDDRRAFHDRLAATRVVKA
jgi:uncharacterized RDD family membrane protein YckC